ncbi:hypothetical protein B0T21DRAFT_357740 [Apiosordaria backusii]|uniref:Uncharacterized protein n=1 Tax=Apiosordaria backusii TaxID=314023 RepID=A0AA40ERX0_9PEZI|nr:hypothetical protein B0T21DRAFT_357740 [Apiosordaria backusii]
MPVLISNNGPITSARDMQALLDLESPPPIMSGFLSSMAIFEDPDNTEVFDPDTPKVQVCMLVGRQMKVLKTLTEYRQKALVCLMLPPVTKWNDPPKPDAMRKLILVEVEKVLDQSNGNHPDGSLRPLSVWHAGNHDIPGRWVPPRRHFPILISDSCLITSVKTLQLLVGYEMEAKVTAIEVVKKRRHTLEGGDHVESDKVQVCPITQRDMDKLRTAAECEETENEGVWLDGEMCSLVTVRERKWD